MPLLLMSQQTYYVTHPFKSWCWFTGMQDCKQFRYQKKCCLIINIAFVCSLIKFTKKLLWWLQHFLTSFWRKQKHSLFPQKRQQGRHSPHVISCSRNLILMWVKIFLKSTITRNWELRKRVFERNYSNYIQIQIYRHGLK